MQIAKTDFGTYKLALIGRPWAKLPWPVGKEKQTLSISKVSSMSKLRMSYWTNQQPC
jgi:hypothetical protein